MAMKWTGKVVGGALGLLTLGPIGLAVGVVLGHQFDEHSSGLQPGPRLNSSDNLAEIGERFFRATFRIMGYLAKADGRVSEREIAAARGVMSDLRLNSQQVQAAIDYFTAGKHGNFDTAAELGGLRHACQGRPELLRVFLEIQVRAALAGNNMEGPVRDLLTRVAGRLGVSPLELAQIETVLRIRSGSFHQGQSRGGYARTNGGAEQLDQAYKVLETTPSASKDEIVKAYRRQLSRHHPDKLKANGLPESMIEHAKQRTQLIIEAYELIRERRGI
ncbi:MAG TPA: co-chaperone DjlA [Steroidobacteraceae bacterium]|jgi:DnaJ like chaperone protein|nr:co-chaperone DjlA [Steroidobacteraceae bacterium]